MDSRFLQANLELACPLLGVKALLQIRAERRHIEQEAGRDFYRSEIRYGTYERTLPLPASATTDDVKATYADGVLQVRVPIPPESGDKATKVPVTRG